MNILISSCLLGINCRYDGENNLIEDIKELRNKYNLIPVCPEVYGGLTTPREPSEIVGSKVLDINGKDVTLNFQKGANVALYLCKLFNIKLAILKEDSPSCGYGRIYDGSFTGIKTKGNGLTADLLIKNNIEVIGESEIKKIIK